ncbi:MAG TPA: LD-carboxypeptidase [Thermoanaerobaculia bacterium]|nr:LD-carboxypeptidase [Thermoanaerobaculia bacterium]
MTTTRRGFLAALSAAGALSALGTHRALAASAIVKPPRLRPGDTIGLVNPATAAAETTPIEILEDGFETLGLRVVYGAHYWDRRGYMAGADRDRAADVNRFFADPSVKALMARGGWGSARVLPHLDFETIAANPKVLIGYSDVTALLLGIHARTGLVTFHGPTPRRVFSAEHLRRVLFDGEAYLLENPREVGAGDIVQTEDRILTIRPGIARGRILGGNLTVLTAIVGSQYLPEWDDCILFIEDVDEAVYRVDRMINQLALAGILARTRGVVFGRCTDCDPGQGYGSLTLEQVLRDHLEPLGVPVFAGTRIGHIPEQFTIPIGTQVEIDATAGSIRLLEAGVV